MFEVRRLPVFDRWLRKLRDKEGVQRINDRLDRVAQGNVGDAKSVGGGVSELRLSFGPGYRVYYTERGTTVIVLLCGGDKSSQDGDIKRAQKLAKTLSE